MSDSALIIRDDSRMSVIYTAEAIALRDDALSQAALIGKVTNATQQADAVSAQTALHSIASEAEKARKACKAPVIEFGQKIDAAAKAFLEEVKYEELRLARLVGDFQQLEQARVRAEENARNEKLREIERQKAQEVSDALKANPTHEQLDAIVAKHNEEAATLARPIEVRAEGQRVQEVWEITVNDSRLLAQVHPLCVEIVPRMSEIKSLLDAGVKVAGVTAKRVIKSGVRVGTQRKAIEV